MRWPVVVFVGAAIGLAACGKKSAETPPVRPVLSTVVARQVIRPAGFAGTVEPRFQTSIGFREVGLLIARDVKVGDIVSKGTRLAAIDPLALQLAFRAARAEVANATAQFANASAVEARQQILLQQNTTTQAQYDTARQAREVAEAAVTRARANLAKAQEQIERTQIYAEFDGVITSVEAEVGQVVQPGQSVVTVARPDAREAVVDVPPDANGSLTAGAHFEILLQLDPTIRTTGMAREVAPEADPATRTRRVWISLESPPPSFRLGTTVTAVPDVAIHTAIELPGSALIERDGRTMVWVVDPSTQTVSKRNIAIATRGDGAFRVAEGLSLGDRVVVAGVHSLAQGQRVKIEDEARP